MMGNRFGAAPLGLALFCSMLTVQVAGAEEVAVAAATPATEAVVQAKEPVATPQVVKSPFGSSSAVKLESLAKTRGGTDPGTLSEMKLNGVVSDNHASNLVTGNNNITDQALAGVSGVPLVVQNSGNNVLIQSATIINVQVK